MYAPIPNTDDLSWEELNRKARMLENEIDGKIITFSKLITSKSSNAVSINIDDSVDNSSYSIDALDKDIDSTLMKLQNVIDNMAKQIELNPGNNSMIHFLQRHRDMYYDYSKDYKKYKNNYIQTNEYNELMNTMKNEVRTFKSNEEYLLNERGRIDESNRMADMVLEQAYSTRNSLLEQRHMLSGTGSRMANITNRFPIINNLIGKISRKKRRNTLILSTVTAVCLFLLIIWLFR
ncbi:V-snare-domain-containing protein [Neocallimastix lanati (nom. inval.)]|jgi:Golgi SNAP receptor complex protein 1|uniref:Golgi SNAP receptor complex member 1 n=1 Tax=Neocallimastix californiae TaxID=1754190 RepID=A0A1Y2F9V1_9FUNG|nr:V-snare-domain-containing protein [Neocallimastix sp. JGI-2020a]ORY79655.1 V-snare-domain-containing protein [Neocallimastix californiae]|eukprot:ORY79655.1 V-snare-domain-containing protein [Neocallimastix californiae]